MIREHRDPRHEHAASGQVDQPPKHRQCVLRQAHEREKHECREQQDAHVWYAPRCRPQKDRRRLFLQRKTVQNSRSREQGLIRRRPSRRDDDGVDHRRHTLEASSARGDDERALRCRARLVVKSGVVARNEHADDEYREDVERRHSDEHPLACFRDGDSWIPGLGCSHGDALDASEAEDGITHDRPVRQESPPASRSDVLHERAGVFPIPEPYATGARDSA